MIFFADSLRCRPPDPLDSMVRTRLLRSHRVRGLVAAARPRTRRHAAGGCDCKWDVDEPGRDQRQREPTTGLIENVQIDCNDIQLFADQAEVFTDIDRVRASGNVVFVSGDQPHRRRADGVQHEDEDRHVLRRVRHRQPGEPRHRAQPVRHAGARRLFLRRDDREARAEDLPHHAAAASPPACSRRRAGRWSRAR